MSRRARGGRPLRYSHQARDDVICCRKPTSLSALGKKTAVENFVNRQNPRAWLAEFSADRHDFQALDPDARRRERSRCLQRPKSLRAIFLPPFQNPVPRIRTLAGADERFLTSRRIHHQYCLRRAHGFAAVGVRTSPPTADDLGVTHLSTAAPHGYALPIPRYFIRRC